MGKKTEARMELLRQALWYVAHAEFGDTSDPNWGAQLEYQDEKLTQAAADYVETVRRQVNGEDWT